MDRLDKCYYWHIITLAKLRLLRKELKRKCLQKQLLDKEKKYIA